MISQGNGRAEPWLLSPMAWFWLFPAATGLLAVAVVADVRIGQAAVLTLGVVGLGLIGLFHRRLLAWRNIVATTGLIILLLPIRREAQISNLPFAIEPYRVLVTLVIAAWIAALLVDPKVTFRRSFLDRPLLAVLAVTSASVLANVGRIGDLGVQSHVTKALLFVIGFFALYWVIVTVLPRAADVDYVVRALVIGGVVVTVFTLVEIRTGLSLFDRIARALPGSGRTTAPDPSIVLPLRGGSLRAFGSAQHPIELSAILAMLVPFSVYLAYTTRRLWWWLALALLSVGTLATLSRTGLIMLIVIVASFVWLQPKMTRLWPLLVPGVVVIHAVAPGAMRELLAAFTPEGGLFAKQESVTVGSGRLESLGPGFDEIASRPFLGGGYGSRIVLGPDANSFIVDNMWLALGMQVGIIGMAVWLWLFVVFVRRTGAESKRDGSDRSWFFAAVTASVVSFAVGMLLFDAFSFVQVTFLLFIVLALGASRLTDDRERARAESHTAPGAKRPGGYPS